ncbi:ATPase AAA domain-containing protein 5 [Dimargaris cristalligena]|uniref:AAA+ ATPase domain-containing protein n=1 Tax=Dimargaris cristalligena TaxID=215637 RepID=A0A4P9ZSZ8_9FUNG|nr:ATPase AAA domain-containing protein 5 [Dimargaris cristalligena]RKP35852.1 hypothetical protein BJ085DRAFT_35165 [Dimargaris cristalligena]|eukprot:RKP35852.1 hypothetical protein BJ085DRAFT_35165 [Dimargaris cristalligena]
MTCQDDLSRFLKQYGQNQTIQRNLTALLAKLSETSLNTNELSAIPISGDAPSLSTLPSDLRHCERLFQTPSTTALSPSQAALPWVEAYKPLKDSDICGNVPQVEYMVRWLEHWKLPGASDSTSATDAEASTVDETHVGFDRAQSAPSRVTDKSNPARPPVTRLPSLFRTEVSQSSSRSTKNKTADAGLPLTSDGFYRYSISDPIFDEDSSYTRLAAKGNDDEDFMSPRWKAVKRSNSTQRTGPSQKRSRSDNDTTGVAPPQSISEKCRPLRRSPREDITDPEFPLDPHLKASVAETPASPEGHLSNIILVLGPVGCGKTAAVYACAHQCNYKVLELNPGVRRSGKIVVQLLSEATQSHAVRGISASQSVMHQWARSVQAKHAAKPPPPKEAKPTSKSIKSFFKPAPQLPAPPPPLTSKPTRPSSPTQPAPANNTLARFWTAAPKEEPTGSQKAGPTQTKSKPANPPHPEAQPPKQVDPVDDAIILSDEEIPSPSWEKTDTDERAEGDVDDVAVETPCLTTLVDDSDSDGSTPSAVQTQPRQLLVLIEEVDIISESDRGFIGAIQAIARKSKRPIILTSNTMLSASTLQELGITKILNFEYPSPGALAAYLTLLTVREGGFEFTPATLHAVCRAYRGDIRHLLNQMEVYTRYRAKSSKANSDADCQTQLHAALARVRRYFGLLEPPLSTDSGTTKPYHLDARAFCQLLSFPSWPIPRPIVLSSRLDSEPTDDLSFVADFGPEGHCGGNFGDNQACKRGETSPFHRIALNYQSQLWPYLDASDSGCQSQPAPTLPALYDLLDRWPLQRNPTSESASARQTCQVLDGLADYYESLSSLDSTFGDATISQWRDLKLDNFDEGVYPEEREDAMQDRSLETEFNTTTAAYRACLGPLVAYRVTASSFAQDSEEETPPPPSLSADEMAFSAGLILSQTYPHASTNPNHTLFSAPMAAQGVPPIRAVLFFPITLGIINTSCQALACDYSTQLRQILATYHAHRQLALANNDTRAFRRAMRGYGQTIVQTMDPFLQQDPAEFTHDTYDSMLRTRYEVLQGLMKPLPVELRMVD